MAQVSAAPLTGPKLDNRRILAAIVDLVIVAAGALVILYAGDALTGDRGGALAAVILGWALYYYFALESGAGQTVGKKLMNLRVVCADGRPAGMREIAVRTILRVIDGIGVYIVGLIVMLVTGQRRQRVGDLAAGTIVVDASGPATAVAEPPAPEADAEEVEDVEDAARVEDVEDVEDAEDADDVDDIEDIEDIEDAESADADQDAHEAPAADEYELSRTITLPSRPEPPVTVSDLAEAEPAVTPEEPAAEVEAEEPAGEELPAVTSPSLEGLAADVNAARDAEDAEDDQPMTVKPVETVSAMDLIMGAADEDAAESDDDEGPVPA